MKKPSKKKLDIPPSALILCGALFLLLVIIGGPTLKRAYENTIKPFFVPAKESSHYINLDKWGVRIPLSPELRGKVMADFYTNNGYGEAFDFYTSGYIYASDKINENGKARLLMAIARIPSNETPFYGEASDYFGEKVVANIDGYKYYFVLADTNEGFVNICARLIDSPSPTQTCNNILPLRSSLYKALLKIEPMPLSTAKDKLDL